MIFIFVCRVIFKTPQAKQNKALEVRVREIYLIRLLGRFPKTLKKKCQSLLPKKKIYIHKNKLHQSSKVQGLAEMREKSINLNN